MKPKNQRATVKSTVDELKSGLEGLSPEWLQTLYETYSGRFIHDNNRIWTTGSIMIPLSLAAFAAVPNLESSRFSHLLILGLASQVMIVSWLIIAENHRASQEKSLAWLIAIEEVIGVKDSSGLKLRGNRLTRSLTFSGAVQKMRWAITLMVVLGWIVIWISSRFVLPPRCS